MLFDPEFLISLISAGEICSCRFQSTTPAMGRYSSDLMPGFEAPYQLCLASTCILPTNTGKLPANRQTLF